MNTSDHDYVSNVRIIHENGPNRTAHLPGDDTPIRYGVHGAIAAHYGVDPDTTGARNTTIDHVVSAAAG